MKKVSWSDRKILWASTLLVVVITIISAIYIGLIDIILTRIIGLIIR